eukprot:TRINITY_DN17789_c0_g1_i1.p2 TRINITY_DN17789_c0_g1~~TRINITY_DN17789_c0_g1_i1.p2  ORF type:complete len:72 (+),score=41.40 TRINITY_DN17789_c0_g1_i1:1-216(+)
METITEGVKAVGEKVSEMASHASYEGNKAVAKDSDNSAGTRVGAAIDAAGDKMNEVSHGAQKEAHKQKATH